MNKTPGEIKVGFFEVLSLIMILLFTFTATGVIVYMIICAFNGTFCEKFWV